jgi:hypothetical protein
MKTKKIEKKLVLNKTTIANLNNQAMEMVRGGSIDDSDSGSIIGCSPVTTQSCEPCK